MSTQGRPASPIKGRTQTKHLVEEEYIEEDSIADEGADLRPHVMALREAQVKQAMEARENRNKMDRNTDPPNFQS